MVPASPEQQITDRHLTLHEHIFILIPMQPVFTLIHLILFA